MFRLTQTFFVLGIALTAAGSDKVPTGLTASDWNGIRAEYERNRHAAYRVGSEFHARNAGQQWLTRFDERGFVLQPNAGGWKWGLTLESYGLPGHERAIKSPARVTTDKERITYRWDSTIEEWFINDKRGLEHGFTLWQRPEGGVQPARGFSPALQLQLSVRGGLHPHLQPDGRGVTFQDAAGQAVLQYAGLKAWDADGKQLPAQLATDGDRLRLQFDDRGSRYPITIDPLAQQVYLKASNTGDDDRFGWTVAISGNTVVVGALWEDSGTTGVNSTPNESAADSGAVYVFVKNSGVWTQQAYLKASNTGAGDSFGLSVGISGDTIVVGAQGEASSTTGVNSTPNENASFAGAAYVFVRNSGVWTQQAYLKASNSQAMDFFGASVAISGDTVVVGATQEDSSTSGVNTTPNEGASNSGAAYVFVRSSGVWSQQAYLKASNPGAVDQFGQSVAISGNTVVVGALNEDSSTTGVNTTPNESATESGAAYVFVRNSGVWTQQAYLKASNTGYADQFGWWVAISGDTAVVGSPLEDSSTTGVNSTPNEGATESGAAYVFVRNSGAWTQQAYLKSSNPGDFDKFGAAVAISGDTIVVGATGEDSSTTGVNSTPNENAGLSGAAYVFGRNSGVWTQQAFLKASNTGASDIFGFSVAVEGNTVVVGAPNEDSNATGVTGNQSDNSALSSGAVYLFNSGAPPVADAGPDQVVECTAQNKANVTLDGSGSSDPDNDPLSFSWSDSGGVLSSAEMFTLPQAVGTKSYTLTVNAGGEQDTDAVSVKVQDTKPPAVTLTLTPDTLSPADRRMVTVTANLKITDCDPNTKVKLVSITSSEKDSGLEPADKPDDIQGEAIGTDDRSFQLRAERAPAGKPKVISSTDPPGRTYTITYEVTDSGNRKKTVSAEVQVP